VAPSQICPPRRSRALWGARCSWLIDVELRRPRSDGLRDEGELEAMGQLEDALVEQLGAAIFVGRVTSRGRVRFVFYAATPLQLPASVAGYSLQVTTQLEPTWRTFARVLYPGPFELQTIFNRSLLEQLSSQGDALTHPRELDHFAFFGTTEQAALAATALQGKGFRVEAPVTADGRTSLAFHRVDSLGDGRQGMASVWKLVPASAPRARPLQRRSSGTPHRSRTRVPAPRPPGRTRWTSPLRSRPRFC
jgi:Family of unknown function (DUF695)/Regulator of ribonuclease activity B